MIPHLFYYQLAILGLLWLCVMLHLTWPSRAAVSPQKPVEPEPIKLKRQHSIESKPFAGLTQKPPCALCAHEAIHPTPSSPVRPDPMPPTNRRPRAVDTSRHFCPHPHCDYRGWLGLGNLRANGHPSGGPWRQFHCTACKGYFPEHHGTLFHGKRVSVDLIVHVIGCLAEGLGIRGTARVFEVDPNTVLHWLMEAAEQLRAFAQYFLHDLHLTQVQLDELYAVLSALKEGTVSEEGAIERLSRSPHWVWAAIDPESKCLVTIDVGERSGAMAQRVVHQVVQVLALGCVPLFLTDGFKEYATALLAHFGEWVQPPRRQATGPAPKPRWMPVPQLLYAQVVKTVRCRRLVRVRPRVVFGTLEAVQQVLAACGWQINTAFMERVNLTIRQHVAAVGRCVTTLCKGEDGLRQQLVLYHVYYNFCLPHASLRVPLPQPLPTHGRGSAKQWRPRTPAMAAGLTDHVWTLREVLLFRVPPWPQPAGL
jgi:transposase-like protein/IS1 family transposase